MLEIQDGRHLPPDVIVLKLEVTGLCFVAIVVEFSCILEMYKCAVLLFNSVNSCYAFSGIYCVADVVYGMPIQCLFITLVAAN